MPLESDSGRRFLDRHMATPNYAILFCASRNCLVDIQTFPHSRTTLSYQTRNSALGSMKQSYADNLHHLLVKEQRTKVHGVLNALIYSLSVREMKFVNETGFTPSSANGCVPRFPRCVPYDMAAKQRTTDRIPCSLVDTYSWSYHDLRTSFIVCIEIADFSCLSGHLRTHARTLPWFHSYPFVGFPKCKWSDTKQPVKQLQLRWRALLGIRAHRLAHLPL